MIISQNKKVSVIVPNYNYARFLKKRIKTILRQTYPIYELIILDDCSTDASAQVIKGIVASLKVRRPDLRVRFVNNEKNSGKSIVQWRKGFELAEGDYVWIAEADDLSNRRFLEEAMRGFDDPEVVLSYTESAIINGKGVMVAPNFRWSRDKERTGHYKSSYVKDGKKEIEEIMAIRCTIPNVSSVVFKKDKNIPYDKYLQEVTKYTQVGDWVFYMKVIRHGKIRYSRKALNYFRVHSKSVTMKSKDGEKHFKEIEALHREIKKKYDLNKAVQRRMDDELERVKRKHGIIEQNEEYRESQGNY